MLIADFGFHAEWNPENRKFNPELAGGALLDIGIYPLAYAYMIFGEEPKHVSSFAHMAPTGVDNRAACLFGYKNGAIAKMSSSFEAESPKEAIVIGTKGRIVVPFFWKAQSAFLHIGNAAPVKHEFPFEATGLQFEAKEVMDCIRAGKTEKDRMPLKETLRVQGMMDRFRREWGLIYPGE